MKRKLTLLPPVPVVTDFITERDRMTHEIEAGALFVANHSGGKDSQEMLRRLLLVVPREQLLVAHASLGDVEWPGALELARDQAVDAGLPFLVAHAPKSFFDLVEHRFRIGKVAWPLASQRQCTSDLKRDPIMREVRRFAKKRGIIRIVTCMGIRAAESSKRKKMLPWSRENRGCLAGREWFNWFPIHHVSTRDVFSSLRENGLVPHLAYFLGNHRVSCRICILGSPNDTRNAAIYFPTTFEFYVGVEKRTGFTCHQSRKPLEEVAGLTVAQAYAEHARFRAKRRLSIFPTQKEAA